jgi:folate-binding protein YgfZ
MIIMSRHRLSVAEGFQLIRTLLYPIFARHGATFVRRGGWELPDEVAGWENEVRAAESAAIVVDRSCRGKIRVTGKDRTQFLHNMLTNDVRSLAPGQGQRAAFLSRKGKLVSDLIVYALPDSILLETEPERLTPLQDNLSRYIVSEDVTLEDMSERESLISVEGPRASKILSHLLDEPFNELEDYHFVDARVGSVPVRVSAVPHGPGPSYNVAMESEESVFVLEQILEVGKEDDVQLAGLRATETRRIEGGIPLFGVDMDESHLLLETGLDDAVSFNKGCYIGQEYVARLAHRGHLNRRLIGIKLEGTSPPLAGDELVGEGRSMGQVTSATFSPALGCAIALGYVHRDFFEPGTTVGVKSRGTETAARVVELPFIG